MSFEEMRAIADFLGIAVALFKSRYDITWDHETGKWMLDANPDGCPLLTDELGCSVHPVKPVQCQTFPFWRELIADDAAWNESKAYCPGMDAPSGKLYSADEIREIADERRGT
jgi:Fe-S-cluster containining protein